MGILNDVKIMLLKGDKGDSPEITETPIDNGHKVTFSYPDGQDDVSFDLHNATSGDYSGLTNKPSINHVLLSGNKSSQDLGLMGWADLSIRTAVIKRMSTPSVVPANSVATIGFSLGDTAVEGNVVFGLLGFGLLPLAIRSSLVVVGWGYSSPSQYLPGAFNVEILNITDSDVTLGTDTAIIVSYLDLP